MPKAVTQPNASAYASLEGRLGGALPSKDYRGILGSGAGPVDYPDVNGSENKNITNGHHKAGPPSQLPATMA